MTNIFEIFNPNDRHWREQKDFDKVHVFTTKKGGRGPMQVDLDDKTIVLPTRSKADPESDKPVKRGSQRAKKAAEVEPTEAGSTDEAPEHDSADHAAAAPEHDSADHAAAADDQSDEQQPAKKAPVKRRKK
ncbi:hypothetical protein ACPCG0_07800 [Propionibacteriaceae bacterium Y1923]|uniref:hypothetical protein n=1 Tax=Aestuariimicrobium sp. Y1814 TaxID=3418742 RepID=UPI003C1F1A08